MPSPHRRGARPTIRRQVGAVALAIASLSAVFTLAGTAASPAASAACSISANLGLGSTGQAVQCLQQTLNAQGYNSGPVDGKFGSVTYRAVRSYQQAKGLYVDGIVGRQTGTALGIWGTATSGGSTGGSTGGGTTGGGTQAPSGCAISSSLRLGSSGAQVTCLQRALAAAGYSPGPADGSFGNQTRAAVVRYQQAKGLYVDGIAGRQTGTALGIWGTPTSGGSTGGGTTGGGTSCTPPVSGVPSGARQVVVVTANGTRADVDLYVHNGSAWTCARSNMSGRVGRSGVTALANRRSGDGSTPGGIFPLGSMTAPDGQTFQFFGNGVNPGVHGTWRQVRNGDCWVATPHTAAYNTLVTRTAANCTGDDEFLINYQNAYSRAAVIGANLGPNRSGDQAGEPPLAAAIFLHRHSYDAAGNSKPTSGCVSLNNSDLIAVLQALVPGQAYFVIR